MATGQPYVTEDIVEPVPVEVDVEHPAGSDVPQHVPSDPADDDEDDDEVRQETVAIESLLTADGIRKLVKVAPAATIANIIVSSGLVSAWRPMPGTRC